MVFLRTLRVTPLLILLCLSIATSHAAIKTWTNPGTALWDNSGNWDLGATPSSADHAFINNGGTARAVPGSLNIALSLSLGQVAGKSGFLSVEGGSMPRGIITPSTEWGNVGIAPESGAIVEASLKMVAGGLEYSGIVTTANEPL